MTYEKKGLLLELTGEPARDTELAASLENATNGSALFRRLELSSVQKESVLDALRAGSDANMANASAPGQSVDSQVEELREWKRHLLSEGESSLNKGIDDEYKSLDEAIIQAYRWRVNTEIAKLHILQASEAGNMRSFVRWNKFVYGKPDRDIYLAALDFVATDAEDLILEHGYDSVPGQAAQEVLDGIAENRGDRQIIVPDETTFNEVSHDHTKAGGYYSLLLAGVHFPEGRIDQFTGEPIIRQVLGNLSSGYDIEEINGSTWSVKHGKRVVGQPRKYSLPLNRFAGLVLGHEIGTHILERVNGERGPLRLVKTGLDRYERGAEGRAIIREQVRYDTFEKFSKTSRWVDILRRHIAISYACGLDDDKPKTSSETYAFMNTIDEMYQLRSQPGDFVAAKKKADKKTGDLILRILKGTNGQAGGAYLKDLVYLEGNVRAWEAARDRGPGAISEGDHGKFDITNPRHMDLLESVGLVASS